MIALPEFFGYPFIFPMPEDNEDHVVYTHGVFRSITVGGVWGIPAFGLVFRKTGEHSVVLDAAVLTHGEDISNKIRLFEMVVYYGRKAGYEVTDGTGIVDAFRATLAKRKGSS